MRTATLDLNSRGSFVDDLNFKPGIVMCRDALLHRSHEIQPAFFDSEKGISFFTFFICQVCILCVAREKWLFGGEEGSNSMLCEKKYKSNFEFAPISGIVLLAEFDLEDSLAK